MGGSAPLVIPGPGAYDPKPMQQRMSAEQYELWPQERHVADTRTAESQQYHSTMTAVTQKNVENFRAEKQRAFLAEIPRRWRVGAPPHAPKPIKVVPPFEPTVNILAMRAGSCSAHYPTAMPNPRPRWEARAPLSKVYGHSKRPISTPALLLSRLPIASTAEDRALKLLHQLHRVARQHVFLPERPVIPHSGRKLSQARGLSIPTLRALRSFFAEHGMSQWTVSELCSCDSNVGLCALTRQTGLSLAETLALMAERLNSNRMPRGVASHGSLAISSFSVGNGCIAVSSDVVSGVAGLVGDATTYVSYEASSARVGELLEAVICTAADLERQGEAADDAAGVSPHVRRFVWIEAFSASQNLLGCRFHPEVCEGEARMSRLEQRPLEMSAQVLKAAREVFEHSAVHDSFDTRGDSCACRVMLPSHLQAMDATLSD